jgi:hypothetical protein
MSALNRFSEERLNAVEPGLYKVYWANGNSSLAAIGKCTDGKRWFACTDWETISDINPTAASLLQNFEIIGLENIAYDNTRKQTASSWFVSIDNLHESENVRSSGGVDGRKTLVLPDLSGTGLCIENITITMGRNKGS